MIIIINKFNVWILRIDSENNKYLLFIYLHFSVFICNSEYLENWIKNKFVMIIKYTKVSKVKIKIFPL